MDDDPGTTRIEQARPALAVREGPAGRRTQHRGGARAGGDDLRAPARGAPRNEREGRPALLPAPACASIRCWTATCRRRAPCCWPRSGWCWRSPAPTSPTCCWRAPPRGAASWRCGRRSAPAAARLLRQLLSESVVLAAVGGARGRADRALGRPAALLDPPRTTCRCPCGSTSAWTARCSRTRCSSRWRRRCCSAWRPRWSASRPDLVPAAQGGRTGGDGPRRRLCLRDVLVVGAARDLAGPAGGGSAAGARPARGRARHRPGLRPAPDRVALLQPADERLRPRARRWPCATARWRGCARCRASRRPRSPRACRWRPTSTWKACASRATTGRTTTPTQIDAVLAWTPATSRRSAIPIVEGRAFSEDDVEGERRVAVINETMARTYWPGRSPLGKRFYIERVRASRRTRWWASSATTRCARSARTRGRTCTCPAAAPSRSIALGRASTTPRRRRCRCCAARSWSWSPRSSSRRTCPRPRSRPRRVAPTRIGAALLARSACSRCCWRPSASTGVIAYSVGLRTREVGVRMALGARPARGAALVLRPGRPAGARGRRRRGRCWRPASARVLESLLYGVSALDPLAYAVAAVVLLAVAAAGERWYRRSSASRIDPMRALRGE